MAREELRRRANEAREKAKRGDYSKPKPQKMPWGAMMRSEEEVAEIQKKQAEEKRKSQEEEQKRIGNMSISPVKNSPVKSVAFDTMTDVRNAVKTGAPLSMVPDNRPTVSNTLAYDTMTNVRKGAEKGSLDLGKPKDTNAFMKNIGLGNESKQLRADDRSTRNAQDPDNAFLKFVKDNTVDIIGEIGSYVSSIPAINRTGKAIGQGMGVDTGQPLSTGMPFLDKSIDFLGNTGGMLMPTGGQGSSVLSLYNVPGVVNRAANVASKVTKHPSLDRAIQEAVREGMVAAPLSIQNDLQRGNNDIGEMATNAALNTGLGAVGGGVVAGVGSAVGRALRKSEPVKPDVPALPEGRTRGNANTVKTDDVITPEYQFKLPEGNRLTQSRMRNAKEATEEVANVDQQIKDLESQYQKAINDQFQFLKQSKKNRGGVVQGQIIRDMNGDVIDRVGRQSENPQWYRDFFAQNGREPTNKELYALAKQHIDEGFQDDVIQVPSWKQENNYDETIQALNQYKDTLSESAEFRGQLGVPESPVTTVKRNEPPIISEARKEIEAKPEKVALTRPNVDDATLVQATNKGPKFIETVAKSENTPPELKKMLEETDIQASRTSDKINMQQASRLIESNGHEKVSDMILAKKTPLSAVENTAAQVLARYYSEIGNLQRAVDIITKTARSGRELGQAIQALTRWNKLDREGAMMLATRQLNRRVRDAEDMVALSPEQAQAVEKPIKGLEDAQSLKSMTQDIVNMMTNRKGPLTSDEKSLLEQFQKAVNAYESKLKPEVSKVKSERKKIIQEVGRIKPEQRKRDQVVKYLDAKAAQAMEALERQKNIGIISENSNPIVLWGVIGASKIANGAVKFADWSEVMIQAGLNNNLNKVYIRAVDVFRKENGLPNNKELNRLVSKAIRNNQLGEVEADNLRALAAEVGFFADDVKRELTQDFQIVLKNLGKSTLGEKVSTFQTASMLLSVPTYLRNALGAHFVFVEKMNKVAAFPIDWAFSKLTGERTIRLLPGNQENMFKNFVYGTKAGWKGVSRTGTLDSYDVQPEAFGGKNPLRYLTKTLGASLQGMDTAAYQSAYGDVLATYAYNIGKAKGMTNQEIKANMKQLMTELDDRVLEMADEFGLYNTFQDETMLSRAAQKVKSGLNAITDIPQKKLREDGVLPTWLSMEGFGLGDVVLKFARTPANLFMRGIDYSPLGIFRSVYHVLPLIANRSKFNQREATLAISRMITGTLGFTGMGYVLAKNGILTGADSGNNNIRSIEEQAGQGAYKVNWSALGRFIMNGLDPEAAKFQQGDTLMDYAWFQPAAISLGMGVNFAEELDKPLKHGQERSNLKKATSAVIGGLSTVLENPMVTGLQKVVDAGQEAIQYKSSGGFEEIAKGVPASFIPAAVGQARTFTDNTQRETRDESFIRSVNNLIKNKTPIASKGLPTSYDSMGNRRERIQGGKEWTFAQFFNAMINPAKITKYNVSPEAKIVLDIMEASNDSSVLPKMQKRSLTWKEGGVNKTVKLSPEQYSRLQKEIGEGVKQWIGEYQTELTDPSLELDAKVQLIKEIMSNVGKEAKDKMKVELGRR